MTFILVFPPSLLYSLSTPTPVMTQITSAYITQIKILIKLQFNQYFISIKKRSKRLIIKHINSTFKVIIQRLKIMCNIEIPLKKQNI